MYVHILNTGQLIKYMYLYFMPIAEIISILIDLSVQTTDIHVTVITTPKITKRTFFFKIEKNMNNQFIIFLESEDMK